MARFHRSAIQLAADDECGNAFDAEAMRQRHVRIHRASDGRRGHAGAEGGEVPHSRGGGQGREIERRLVEVVREQGRVEHEIHKKVYRPWGWYEGVERGERFQVKQLVVKPGQKSSMQIHHHRSEHWVVVKGTAEVTLGETKHLLTEDQSIYIPLGVPHRIFNPGRIPMHFIEVQAGSYLEEDDIVRIDDEYGR